MAKSFAQRLLGVVYQTNLNEFRNKTMTGMIVAFFIAAGMAISFLTVKRIYGAFSHSEQWYARAFVILAFCPSTYVVVSVFVE